MVTAVEKEAPVNSGRVVIKTAESYNLDVKRIFNGLICSSGVNQVVMAVNF